MQQAIYKLGTLSVLTVLTISTGILYFQKNSDTELLSHRLNLLEEKLVQSTPDSNLYASNEANNELADVQGKIITLQNQLDRIDSHLSNVNKSQIVKENEKLAATETKADDHNTALPQESKVVATIKNTGYLYEEDWKKLEQTLTTMDKDENKQFWQSMTSAIENNEIELYSE